jgi:2-desacetyl-2-hydroxyethyl bacteriochlorophyllide A dehydrogenase
MKSRAIVFPEKMRAELVDIDVPAPGDGEILVKNLGCGICQIELRKFKGIIGDFPMDRLGHEGIGRVAAVGPGVKDFREGDLVTTLWQTAFQEYNVGRQDWAIVLPPHLLPRAPYYISEPPACVLNGFTAAMAQPADKVLIVGTGYMGLLLVQLFARASLSSLTILDIDPDKLRVAREMGATATLDSFSAADQIVQQSGQFDVVIEASGAAGIIESAAKLTRFGGRLVIFADHRHRSETINWGSFQCLTVAFANPLFNPDFVANWRSAVKLLLAGKMDQSKLVTHLFPAEKCQEAMMTVLERPRGFIKGYISWV